VVVNNEKGHVRNFPVIEFSQVVSEEK